MPDTDIAFEPEIDFEPEGAAPPVPSVGDLIQRTQPWTSRQDASAQMERATGLNPSPTLPPSSGRLSIAPPHQGTATQEVERQAGPPLVLQPTAKPTPLAPPPANQNQITPVARPALSQPGIVPPVPAEPKQKVTLVSTGFGAPTWIANDGSLEGREQAAQLNAAESEAVRGVTGVSGYPKIAEGLKNLVPTATQPYPTRRQAMGAGAEVLGGVGEALTPAMVTGAAAAPVTTIEAVLGSMGAKKGAELIADRFKASPEAKALIGEVAATVGAIGGGISGVADQRALANFKPIEDSLTTLLQKRGYVYDAKGQQMRITSEAGARAAAQAILKSNPVSLGDAVRIWRESRNQQFATPVEGEYVGEKPTPITPLLTGNAPITRAEASEYLERTNYDLDAARALAAKERAAKPTAETPVPTPVVTPLASQVPAARTPAGPVEAGTRGGVAAPAAKAPEIEFTPETELAQSEVPVKPAAVLPKPVAQPPAAAAKTEEVAKPVAAPAPQGAEQVAAAPSEQPPVHKFGNTQANIPEGSEAHGALETARARISDSDLAGQGKNVEGNHVTVRYGIQGDDVEGIKKFLSEQAPFEASLGKTDVFPPSKSSGGAAVVMAPIEAPELHRLNDEIQKHGEFTESTHPDYRPHATVAYVKPEAANRYKGMSVTAGKKFTVDSIAISHKDGTTEVIKLEGTKGGTDASASKSPPAHVVDFEPEEKPATTKASGAPALADAVFQKLRSGESLGNVTEFNKLAEQHFGSSRVSGKWSPKDAFDAMEAGVNKYLLHIGKETMARPVPEALQVLRNLMKGVTSQGARTEEQIKNQQFSTPPTESYVAAKVAGLKPSDVVLEPSAGNGGLAVWPKAIGAAVHVNEIAPRRQEMLKEVGFEKPTAHDGEIINSLLDQKIKPTVVLMNPPFSASAIKSYESKNRNQYGFNHVDSALQRLQPGGRLVAILGGGQANEPNGGASLTTGPSGQWFERIADKYNVRANIRVHGKEYQKYGTSFATRIIVIDKDGPTPSRTTPGQIKTWDSVQQGNVNTLEEAYDALKDVAESRPNVAESKPAAQLRRSSSPGESQPTTRVAATGVANQPSDRGGVRAQPATGGRIEPANRPHQPDRNLGGNQPSAGSERVPVRQPEVRPEEHPQAEAARSPKGSADNADRERPLSGTETSDAALSLGREDSSLVHKEEEDSAAYVAYRPTLKGPAHPANIVETRTMATVPLPEITYKPSLPESVIKEGKLSAVQLEAISIAGQQNSLTLPNGARSTALIGDGTGVGKGRIAAGILWDNFRQGRKRLVWVSEKWDLMQDAIRDLNGIGATDLAKTIKPFGKISATDPIDHQGILFTTYALIRSADKKGNTRVGQLEHWMRGQDEGDGAYIVYDESHNLKNAVAAQAQQVSQIGAAIKKLMEKNPKIRSASLSATAATDVINLGYLDRLGLWGPGTPFPEGFGEFQAQIASGGMSAMEMVARELKAQGKYVSRTLSYKGVTYQEVEHVLTDEQKALYRTATKAWASVVQQAEDTIKNTTNGGALAKSRFMSLFYGAQLRFFNVLLTTLKIPTTVDEANKALEAGKSVVISLVNTNEAAQNREKNRDRGGEDSEEIPDYDFGPGEMLKDLVREHYPIQQFVDDVDSEGRPIKVPAYIKDAEGRDIPLTNPQAIKERDKLLADLDRDLKMPANPLDILINSLGGHKNVAELTGRKERYDEASGKFVPRGDPNVKRDEINLSEMRAFQAGKKRVAVLSSAAGTGISLHAGNDVANQQKRRHITLQVGWSADKAMQMLGRTHRSNEAHQPEYAMLTSDLGGEKRFTSTLAKRMGSLGALSKGQSNANAGTDLMEKVNFESPEGQKATNAFYNAMLANRDIPGTKFSGMQVLTDLRVLKTDPATGAKTVPPADRTNVTRLLNRLLALDPDVQNSVYNYFYDIFQAVVQQAVEDGTLDTGVKTLPGDEFSVKEERSISRDPKTNAETFYYPIDAQVRTNRVSPKDLNRILKANEGKNPAFMRNKAGEVLLRMDASPIVHADGRSTDAFYLVAPGHGNAVKVPHQRLSGWEAVTEKAAGEVTEIQNRLARAESELDYSVRTAERYPGQSWAQNRVDQARGSIDELRKDLEKSQDLAKDPEAWAKEQWEQQYNQAPAHTTVEHHLIGGAVMRWWNAIHEASPALNIYTTVDSKSGKRVVGVDIPSGEIRSLLSRITGGGSTVNASQLQTDVLKNGLSYTLEKNIQVRQGRINRQPVVQFIPPNQDVANNLKRLGLLYEKGIQPIYYLPNAEGRQERDRVGGILEKILGEYPAKESEGGNIEFEPEGIVSRLVHEESGTATPAALNPARITRIYKDFIDQFIDKKLDLGDKYRRVADHDPVIAKMLKEKDNAPRYFHDKAESNVEQVIKGLNEHQVRLAAMLSDSDAREHLEEHYPDQYDEARQDPAVMDAVNRFKQYQDQLAAIRIKLGWHVRHDLSTFEDEAGKWSVLDRNGDEVESFESQKDAQDYVEANGNILDHLKRTYPEHLREPLMGRTDEGPSLGASHGGIRPPRPDRKQRLATAEYFYTHGAKDFSGYVKSYTQAYHAALNQKIYDSLTDEATKWKEGTARPPQIEYRGKTYYSPDVAKSMKLAAPANRPKTILEYRAYDPAKDDKAMIRDFENGWSTITTGRPGISPSDRYLAPKEVVDALEHYDMTRGQQENDSIRRFFQDQIVGLFGPNIHVLNIMRRLSHVVGSGPWDPRVWPYYQKLFFSKELRDRMADGLADDAIDALSKWGTYTNTRDIGSLHTYVLGNMNPANWVRQTVGKFSKGVLFDPKFLGGFGGLDQKSRVLAYDFLHDRAGMGEEEASKNVEDGFGNYNKSNWSERMKRWARALLFPGWDFSSLKWFLRHPIKTALYPALVTMGANLALNAAGKNKDGDKYDFAYLHYGDRKFRTGLITESMALHIATPVFEAARAALEGGDSRDIARAAWSGALRGGGGLAGVLRPEIQAAAELLSNRQYMGGTKEIWKPEDAAVPGKVAPTRQLDKALAFSVVKAFPAISRFLDSSYDNVDLATGVGSIVGVTNYKSGAEERLKANVAKSMSVSQTLSILGETEPDSATKLMEDPNKAIYVLFHNDLDELSSELKKLDQEVERVKMSGEMSQNSRKETLKSLEESRKQMLLSADALNDALDSAKLQMKNGK